MDDSPLSSQDPLDAEIAAKEATAVQMERDLDILRVEIRTLRRAAELRPTRKYLPPTKRVVLLNRPAVPLSPTSTSHLTVLRGKTPGALSMQWRSIMRKIVANGNHFMPPDLWAVAAAECGYEVVMHSAGDWLRRAAVSEFGYIERDGEAFRVSESAIQRFNLKAPEPPPEVTRDGSA